MKDRKPIEISISLILSTLAILISCAAMINLHFNNQYDVPPSTVVCKDKAGVVYTYTIHGDMEPKRVCEKLNKDY